MMDDMGISQLFYYIYYSGVYIFFNEPSSSSLFFLPFFFSFSLLLLVVGGIDWTCVLTKCFLMFNFLFFKKSLFFAFLI